MISKVVVLSGGLSHERDVSLRSGRRVAEAIRAKGIEVDEIDPDSRLTQVLSDLPKNSVIFPTLHGAVGEDGSIRDVLEMLHLPYVGSSAESCRRAFDKPIAKSIVAGAGIRTTPSRVLPHSTFRELGASNLLPIIASDIEFPLMVKPTKGGSALGASVIRTPAELPEAMIGAFAYGDDVLIEPYIAGTEIAVSVYEENGKLFALPAVEIKPDTAFYSYDARYTAGITEFFIPARIPDQVSVHAATVAKSVHQALGLRDISRSDLIVDDQGHIWFLEVNVSPGMTETSLFPQAASEKDLGAIYISLCEAALNR